MTSTHCVRITGEGRGAQRGAGATQREPTPSREGIRGCVCKQRGGVRALRPCWSPCAVQAQQQSKSSEQVDTHTPCLSRGPGHRYGPAGELTRAATRSAQMRIATQPMAGVHVTRAG